MAQLACGNAVNYQRQQYGGDAQSNAQRVNGSSLFFVALVQHQVIETASQAGDQRQHQ